MGNNRATRRSAGIAIGALLVAVGAAVCLLLTGCTAAAPMAGSEADRLEVTDVPGENGDGANGSQTLESQAQSIVGQMTLEEKVAQMFIVRPEAITGVGVAVEAGDATRQALEKYPVGGIIYFGDNLENPDQTRTLLSNTQQFGTQATGLPLFLCVDEEGGTVARIGGNEAFGVGNVGNMSDVGATGDVAYAKQVATDIGAYLVDLGFNVDFAPDADVANNPASDTMALRAFGTTGDYVAPFVSAQVEGFTEAGILSCAKHFPGIGGAEGDSHMVSIYSHKTIDQMAADELLPFQAAIEAGVPFIMVGHLSTPEATGNDIPASVNPGIVTDVLRNQLGFEGMVITDSMSMGAVNELYEPDEAAIMVIEAGVDIVLMPADFNVAYQGVLDAVTSGRISEERIDQSVLRIVEAKLAL